MRCMTETRVGIAFLLPALTVLALVSLYPILALLWLSMRHRVLPFQIDQFIGFDNYALLFVTPRFWNSLTVTGYFAGVSVAIEVILGLGIALLLSHSFKGVGWVRAAVLLPWAIPTVVTAKIWDWMYQPQVGVLNYVLQAMHLTTAPIHWLGSPSLAIHAAIVADVWKTTPFVVILLLAAIAMIPRDLYRAAAIDGASSWHTFWHITLPQLRTILIVVILFRMIDAMRVFDLLFVMTGGGPADMTETLSIYTYKILFQTLQFGYGSAIGVVMFLLVASVSLLQLWIGRNEFRRMIGTQV
ncbi:MAG TPA: sugar ABC transporter permease [Nitrospirales bacterium]|nr:sugar ABC transporter permease [Nitrospirales bacterium]HIA14804.1 sugar ABC transporter permease [Nitrospirales bacterium]HIB53318.1 sugar ABC transporter permease [Nitrospirales bacterium]HIC04995.1 sugar ABC transporter permease [Nitrospirales bacterium]HIN33271.1 sugar ABC transporter permease [Nitrospirales bacterium]